MHTGLQLKIAIANTGFEIKKTKCSFCAFAIDFPNAVSRYDV